MVFEELDPVCFLDDVVQHPGLHSANDEGVFRHGIIFLIVDVSIVEKRPAEATMLMFLFEGS